MLNTGICLFGFIHPEVLKILRTQANFDFLKKKIGLKSPNISKSSSCPNVIYSKTCVKPPLSKDRKLVLKTNYCLMQDKSIAECSKGSIQQYFRPSLSYHLSLRSLFCLFLSGCLTQVLLYPCKLS